MNRYFSAVALRVSPGNSPPSGPAIQCGKKPVWVVAENRLGRSAATTTTSTAQSTIASSAHTPITPSRLSVHAGARVRSSLTARARSQRALESRIHAREVQTPLNSD